MDTPAQASSTSALIAEGFAEAEAGLRAMLPAAARELSRMEADLEIDPDRLFSLSRTLDSMGGIAAVLRAAKADDGHGEDPRAPEPYEEGA